MIRISPNMGILSLFWVFCVYICFFSRVFVCLYFSWLPRWNPECLSLPGCFWSFMRLDIFVECNLPFPSVRARWILTHVTSWCLCLQVNKNSRSELSGLFNPYSHKPTNLFTNEFTMATPFIVAPVLTALQLAANSLAAQAGM